MVALSQTGSVRDFPAYLHFTPRPDQPERFDEQTAFYESKGDGCLFLTGGNGAGCLAAEQTVYDPVEGRDRVVSEIDSGFHVIARNAEGNAVVAKAEQPRIYGTEDLYEITLSNGQIFRATLGHRLLTLQGWREIGDIVRDASVKVLLRVQDIEAVYITSCEFLRRDSYWDFHVPEYENYWMAGVWNHNTTSCLIAKICRFVLETPPPRRDTPFWVIAETYEQIGSMWDEKFNQQGHLPPQVVDWPRIHWNNRNNNQPFRVPLKSPPGSPGKNWSLEFKSWRQGRGKMQARSLGGFGFIEQFPWGILEEVLRGCREYNFPGSKLIEFTPVDADLSQTLEEMIENGYEPEKPIPGLKYLPKNWQIFHANTMCAMEAGHVDKRWFEEFFGMVPEDMLDTRMKGMFSTYEGVIYKDFNVATHCMGDEMWGRIKHCRHRRGIDWGAGPENDFSCVWAAKNGLGQWFVYDEYVSNDQSKTTVDHLTEVYHRWEWPDDPMYGPTYCDPSSPDNLRIGMKLNQYNPSVENLSMMRGKNSVLEGIEHIQYLLKPQIPVPIVDAKGMPVIDPGTGKVKIKLEPKLFIHRTNCPKLVQQMKTYRWLRGADPSVKAGRNSKDPLRAPLKKADHSCIRASSLITMHDGSTKPITEVRAGEYIMSHLGASRVLESACTGFGELWRVTLSDGTLLDCTGDHPIWQAGSYRTCQSLLTQKKMALLPNALSTAGKHGSEDPDQHQEPQGTTSKTETDHCTGRFTSTSLAKYQQDFTSIIEMETHQIITPTILKQSQHHTMQSCTTWGQCCKVSRRSHSLQNASRKCDSMGNDSQQPNRELQHAEEAGNLQQASSLLVPQSAQPAGWNSQQKQLSQGCATAGAENLSEFATDPALSVEQDSQFTALKNPKHAAENAATSCDHCDVSRCTKQSEQMANIQNASRAASVVNNPELQRQKPVAVNVRYLTVVSVQPLNISERVYNLATEDGTYFANGILTSNCDALRYLCFSDDFMTGSTISSAKAHSSITTQLSGEYLPDSGRLKGFTTRHRERG